MEVHFKPDTEVRLQELAKVTGRPTEELVEDALVGYLTELSDLREMLHSRYEDITAGRVAAVNGERAFEDLRRKSRTRRS